MTQTQQLSSRSYGVTGDYPLLHSYLSELTETSPPHAYWHPGDLTWLLFPNLTFDPMERIRLWFTGETLLGFAVLKGRDLLVMQIRPGERGRGALEEQMLSWAAESLGDQERNPGGKIHTLALESDRPTAALLEGQGFEKDASSAYNLMHRELKGAVTLHPPEGWSVRPVDGEAEWQRRVDLHRDVWTSSKVTLEAYRRLRTAPGYDPELDLVAVNDEGAFGAYCICWYDPGSRTGLFEPVGTSSSYRRRGLARAVIAEGLSRLQDAGAESVLVTSESDNDASLRLYEAAGFRTVDTEYTYSKKVVALC